MSLENNNNRSAKIFIWGGLGIVGFFVLVILFVFLSMFNTGNNTPKQKEINPQKNINSNQVNTDSSSSADIFVTLEPQLPKITYPSVTFIDPQIGSKDAPITIIEFSDFNCPYCSEVQSVLQDVLEKYDGIVRLAWKNLPITEIHPSSLKAAEAAMCAADQDKFWPYHDLLFKNQGSFSQADLVKLAKDLDLDAGSFEACLDDRKMFPRIQKSLQEAKDLQIDGTPHFYINHQEISGVASLEDFSAVINVELNKLKNQK